ncbi:cytochrome P450 3A24-like [Bradysia coprophila]|uniref:cytochrome P450 3A24-like n=1 Tax=Bradysia coprophila TaxID=38358 RepID=UPI00187D8609|nr:cytochrome P450 3A24-like [Bradysia coprophila]
MLILALVVISLFYLIYMRQQQMSTMKRLGIPGPRPNFIFGHLIEIVSEGFNSLFPKWTKKYGPIVGFYIGGRPQLLVTDLELIRRVLVKDFQIFSNRSEWIPGGIHPTPTLQKMMLWARDNVWKNLRATISPSFSPHKLNAMEPLMMISIRNLFDELDDKAGSGREFNLKPLISDMTFSSASKCIFGLNMSLKQLSTEAESFAASSGPRLEKSMLAMTMMLFPSLTFIVYPLRVCWERLRMFMLWSADGVTYDVARKIVQTRRAAKSESNDFLQLLMNAKRIQTTTDANLEMSASADDVKANQNLLGKQTHSESLSEEEILSNAMLFLLASYETTSLTLQFCLHNLVNHQSVQDRLRTELRKAVAPDKKTIKSADLSTVPLLNQIINETLRMFPPVAPFTTRVANEDYRYEDIRIPKGTSIFIGVSSIHKDPTFWPEPEKFRPERFERELDEKLAFLPFGGGPRNCIGMRFAYMEVQLVLANLILQYRFEPGPSTEKDPIETEETFVTLLPKNGVFCRVTKIEE